MIISKLALPRRTVLRGLGATVALPLLDAMVPAATALAQTAARPASRLGFVYIPNGVIQEQWVPAATGVDDSLANEKRAAGWAALYLRCRLTRRPLLLPRHCRVRAVSAVLGDPPQEWREVELRFVAQR